MYIQACTRLDIYHIKSEIIFDGDILVPIII